MDTHIPAGYRRFARRSLDHTLHQATPLTRRCVVRPARPVRHLIPEHNASRMLWSHMGAQALLRLRLPQLSRMVRAVSRKCVALCFAPAEALGQSGCNVLLPSPGFSQYEMLVRGYGGEPRFYNLLVSRFIGRLGARHTL